MAQRPQNVGIKALEIYFPNQYVDQADLEKFQGASTGKYTIGLGQQQMSFCDDREDICSIALTTVSSLLRKYAIDPTSIGRLEVGTESLIDKAKSVKSVLTQLFEPAGNTALEGVDTYNACYGGTNALFNAINWVESSSWDGRDAIVVAGDIALYKETAAKPTGGAGCVAMLIGPDAPLAHEPRQRGTYMTHAFDFYKPNLKMEYPLVDGQLSITCYLAAVDSCYREYQKNSKAASGTNGVSDQQQDALFLDTFDHIVFHTPNCKLVSKSYARMLYNDYLKNPAHPEFAEVPEHLKQLSYEASLRNKELEKTFIALSKQRFQKRVQVSTYIPSFCGNMYTASVYSSLISLISNSDVASLVGKKVGVFSYGSGLASTLYSFRVTGDLSSIVQKLDVTSRLKARNVWSAEAYHAACQLRETAYGKESYVPVGDVANLASGTYYLTGIDDRFRRSYEVKQ